MTLSLFSRNTPARRVMLVSGAVAALTLLAPVFGLAAESVVPGTPAGATATTEVQFMRDIAPILVQRCFSCHGPKEPEADLRLDSYEGMTSGEHPAVIPGDPEYSGIMQRVTEEDSSSRMPRDDDPLTPAQIDTIRRWIKDGAKFDGPDPKKPYAVKPEVPGTSPAASPHPVRPPSPADPADREHKTPKAQTPAPSEVKP